jgi:hypothetical protein
MAKLCAIHQGPQVIESIGKESILSLCGLPAFRCNGEQGLKFNP